MQHHELKVRLPEGVRNYLSIRAQGNDRSMNAELVNILKNVMNAEPVSQALIPRRRGTTAPFQRKTVQ